MQASLQIEIDAKGGEGEAADEGRGSRKHIHHLSGRGLVFKAHRLCVSPNSRLDSNKADEKRERNPIHNTSRDLVFRHVCEETRVFA